MSGAVRPIGLQVLFALAFVQVAYADFIVGFTNGPAMARYTDAGQFLLDFTVFEGGAFGESMSQPVLGPDSYIYAIANDLGHATIERFDPATGLASDGNPFASFSGTHKIPNYAAGPGPNFGPTGDLFVIDSGFDAGVPRVLRINGNNGLLRAETQVNTPSEVPLDILAKSSGVLNSMFDTELLLTKPGGKIQRYLSNQPLLGPSAIQFVETLETGLAGIGEMELGPDGLLYLVDATNRSIVRYNLTTESIVDTFIPSVPLVPGASGSFVTLGSLRFSPDGDLFILNGGSDGQPLPKFYSEIRRYDGSTGQFEGVQFTLPVRDWNLGVPNGIEYLPIPEPSSAMLLAAVGIATGFATRARPIRR